ncbi:MAG: MFS transporter [Cycloclasticus sp.]|nr:MFS transporter [Cycloclasticus sp.]
MEKVELPYWRLSGFYFFYFASLGALLPYLGLYLNSIGLVAAQVGFIFAAMQATKLVSPSCLAWLSSRFNDRMRLVQLSALLSAVTFMLLFSQDTFMMILWSVLVFSFFWNAMLPQFESITLTKLAGKTHAYSNIRLWGSVGFIATVAGAGFLLDCFGLSIWPWMVALCLLAIFISSLLLNEKGRTKHPESGVSVLKIVKEKRVIAFFLVVFLIQASHGAYYVFYSILLNSLNYSETEIGQFWSLGVLAEILLFMIIQHVFKHLSLRFVLLISILLTSIRWLMIGWLADSIVALLIAQLLHAATFGSFHVVCIQLTHRYFQGAAQDKGQALYSSIGYGAGGMCGGLIAGGLWDSYGGAWVFTISSLLSFIALWVAWFWIGQNNNDDLHASGEGVSSL